MVKYIDVDAVLEKIREHAMNIIGKEVYLPLRNDSDSPYEIRKMRIANIRCDDIAKESKYGINSITLDDEFLVKGRLYYEDIGSKVFTDKENAIKAMNGHPYLIGENGLSPYVVTKDLMDIKEEIVIIHQLAEMLRGQQAIFIVKDELHDKYQCVIMDLHKICVFTAATIPGGSYTSNKAAVFLEGKDYIGGTKQQYGEWCFYNMQKAMDIMYQKNSELMEKKRKESE